MQDRFSPLDLNQLVCQILLAETLEGIVTTVGRLRLSEYF